jgi:hypothetical protein
MAELEKNATHLVEMMKYEKGDGDNDIWMSKESQSAYEPLIKNNYCHMDVQKQGHHERNGSCE